MRRVSRYVPILVAVLVLGSAGLVVRQRPIAPDPVIARHVSSSSPSSQLVGTGKLPLRFEANAGQWDERVRFLTRQGGATLFITDEGMTFDLLDVPRPARTPGATRADEQLARRKALAAAKRAAVTMKLAGATPRTPRGEVELATKTNYFLGDDKTKWRTDVPNYGEVRAKGWRPGVDVVWHGRAGGLEYDLEVAPGVDAAKLELAIEGATRLTVARDGSLEVATAAGTLVQKPPRVVQDGRELATRYALVGRDRVRFVLEGYDRRLAVLIDPTLVYATYLGGSGNEGGGAIVADASGAAYVTGATASTNFPTQAPLQAANGGGNDVFIAKLNPAGSALVYATYLGGSGDEGGAGIAVDASGNAHVTGRTTSTDFPTQAPLQAANGGNAKSDVFVVKLNAAGSALLYSTYLGGSDDDNGNGIVLDGNGDAYVTGETQSMGFPTTPGSFQPAKGYGYSAFVTKLNGSGSALLYSTFVGGSSDNVHAYGIAVDAGGSALITGGVAVNYGTTPPFTLKNPVQASAGGGAYDAFVAKLNAAGSALVYATLLGGNGWDQAWAIAVDGSGNAYVTGITGKGAAPTVAFPQTPAQGTACYTISINDEFISKLSSDGSALIYSRCLDSGSSLAVDGEGHVFLPNTGGVTRLNTDGSTDYTLSLDANSNAVALDPSGNLYFTGSAAPDFSTMNPLQATSGGMSDAFVIKLGAAVTGCVPANCPAGFCADGVCCDRACDGNCEACVASLKEDGSADGTCGPIKKGTDPRFECQPDGTACGADGVCDGMGACRAHAPASTICSKALCVAGVAMSTGYCDGNGKCPTPPSVVCGSYACESGSCLSSCVQNSDCSQGNRCDTSSSTCLAFVGSCDGDHTLATPEGAVDCAPYRCGAEGTCLKACSSTTECAGSAQCDSTGHCAAQPGCEATNSCGPPTSSGCGLAPGEQAHGACSILIALALLALVRRRRADFRATNARSLF